LTVPLPVPLAPDVIVIQPALLVAVQAHPLAAVTLTEPLPPLAGIAAVAGNMLKLQHGAMAGPAIFE
jgi:hypothetical protein